MADRRTAATGTTLPPPAGSEDALQARAVVAAASWVQDGRRLDMQGLAAELGVSRVTLFRRAGGRDDLLGEALWHLTERSLRAAERAWERERDGEAARCPGVLRLFNQRVSTAAGLRRLLDEEPAVTIRVLTDPRGRIQPRVVGAIEALLRRDADEGLLTPIADPGALAYALVRLGESFLYADVLASRSPDLETANRLQQALMQSDPRDRPDPTPDPRGAPAT